MCWVLPENWTAVSLFLECSDQWHTSPDGKFIGIRSEAAKIEIEYCGFDTFKPEDWKRFRRLSRYVAKELNA
ncbi:MAG: DUF1799 domain-containing protein [Neptuniibacter sp.]